MDLEVSSDDALEPGCPQLGERIMLGVVRLASLPLFLLVIILSCLIYGIAMLARLVAVIISVCLRVVGLSARSWSRPVKVHDV